MCLWCNFIPHSLSLQSSRAGGDRLLPAAEAVGRGAGDDHDRRQGRAGQPLLLGQRQPLSPARPAQRLPPRALSLPQGLRLLSGRMLILRPRPRHDRSQLPRQMLLFCFADFDLDVPHFPSILLGKTHNGVTELARWRLDGRVDQISK